MPSFDSTQPLFIGKQHTHLEFVDSTNTYATETIAKSNPIEGSVISTSYQTNGRGQIGRYWESAPDKNILCSIILYPTFLDVKDQFYLSICASLATYDLLAEFVPDNYKTSIKWPNDIYIDDQKIAGILIQNSIGGSKINSCVLGFGINVNQENFSENIPNPISLKQLSHDDYDLEVLMKSLFIHLERRYIELKTNRSYLLEEYLQHLYLMGRLAPFIDIASKEKFSGEICGIAPSGQLRVKVNQGEIKLFGFREIAFQSSS